MPSVAIIVWTGISGLIVLMLAVIGYLISSGFDGLKQQLKTIWDKMDLHQHQAEINARDIAVMKEGCRERHANHQRVGDPTGSQ